MSLPARPFTLVAASLVADALALPAHWIYEPARIAERFGRVTELAAPPADAAYHAHEPAGGQTHYGAQALVLLRAIAEAGRFDAEVFARRWQAAWADGRLYVDGATRETLAALADGLPPAEAGSRSRDLGGAARVAPLVATTLGAPEVVAVEAAWTQTALTHRDPAVCEAAAFLTRAARATAAGATVAAAIEAAAGAEYVALPVCEHLARARAAASDVARGATTLAGLGFGLACPVDQAFPATLALALAHGDDLEGALIANVMAGGDSAARGLALGLLIGARPGVAVPPHWLAAWRARAEVEAAFAAAR